MKNARPATIAVIIAILSTLLLIIILLVNKINTVTILLECLFFLAATFVISFFFIELFLYRKIKLIYKTIHDLKLGKNLKEALGENLSLNPIKDVEREVLKWAIDKRDELDRMEISANFRRDFLANFSHEVKTPLFNVQGYLEMLLQESNDMQQIKFLNKLVKNVDRLCILVADLDQITLLESGAILLKESNFFVIDLFEEVKEILEPSLKENGTTIIYKKGNMENCRVSADKEKISQVLINLISNAIKYGNKNGTIDASWYEMGENILIEITDYGIGIAEVHLNRIFERFYRIDMHRNSKTGGTGLGLSIAKHIIEAHNQNIHVRSTLGVGSTFGFTLKMV
jgi:two-component system phosphate regulon sensor histidine kinase PhoR